MKDKVKNRVRIEGYVSVCMFMCMREWVFNWLFIDIYFERGEGLA